MLENNNISGNWIAQAEVQKFFNYKPTQMAALLKNKLLKVAKVGKRKFISRQSLEAFLEKMAQQ